MKLGKRWGILKWVVNFLDENSERWDKEKLEKMKAAKDILEDWNKKTRQLKIRELKLKRKETKHPENTMQVAEGWKVWEMKEDIKDDGDEATTDEKSDLIEVTLKIEALEEGEHNKEK